MTAMTMGTVRSKILLTVLVLVMLFGLSNAAWAANTCPLNVDGLEIGTNAVNADGEAQIYMDVQPEVKNGVCYVPLRFIGELFGAQVDYADKQVKLALDDTTVSLTIGHKLAVLNGKSCQLLGASYTKAGRTMVPLRFISEAFGCNVNYEAGKVWINTLIPMIDGKTVGALHIQSYMTMGGRIDEVRGHIFVKRYYQALLAAMGDEVAAPQHYGKQYVMDMDDYYYLGTQNHFVDAAGLDGKAILTLTDYSLVVNPYSEEQKELPQYLMHDETADKWYKLDYEAYMAAGKWCMGGEEIFNNVV